MITTVESSSFAQRNKSRMASPLLTLKYILLDVPLWLTLFVAGLAWMTNDFYHGPMQTLVESYRRSGEVDPEGYYPDFFPDITYYARQCTGQDVTTQSSNDIVFRLDNNSTSTTTTSTTATSTTTTTSLARRPEEEAADIMMTHGAVLVPQILTVDTARQLRDYLETRNTIKDQLSWFEKFWGDIGRLSLGLGVDDAPIIAQALKEVATHPGLNAVLKGIVGEDPAVVEISTLTTLQGAQPQGIHTDSDFFGSSLLYSRTFLHSYTLFMALQDTTPRMGATTICPGTHWCANDDLTDVCGPRSSNAFEVSSNGQTGKDVGMLHTGDGMMFNQNIWHRGPKNSDPMRPMNRVMFIVTFVSRLALEEGDVRQQGIGTYYYQRWNMWGHTLNDLKRASQTMWQPVAALKALGLWKMSGQWGILWLEHFARQLANREDFFATHELPDFLRFLDDKVGMPRWLQGRPEHETRNDRRELKWESFLKQLGTNIAELCLQIHFATLGVYAIVSVMGVVVLGTAGSTRMAGIASLLQRILQTYLMAGLIFGCLWYYVHHLSYLSKRIQLRDSWREPFSPVQSMEHLQRTTFPTRSDVLVGSRFDAPYLSSFDKVLDYHPGNIRFARALNQAQLDMPVLLEARVRPGRFLQQDHVTGYWMQMDASQVQSYLQRQVYAREFSWVGKLDDHLKQVLADARFGKTRETALSRRFTPALVEHWQSILYRSLKANDDSSTSCAAHQLVPVPVSKKTSGWNKLTSALVSTPKSGVSAMSSSLRSPSTRPRMYKPMRHFVQGDAVEVLADDDQYWDPATILYIDPFERATVRYEESGEEELVYMSIIRHALEDDEAMDEEEEEEIILEEGSRVMARFEGSGKFFPGYVHAVVSDNVYAIQFDDGDYDAKVPLEAIVASGAASPAYG